MSDTTEASNGFDAFGLDARLVNAILSLGFDTPTPIQQGAIPPFMQGRDLIGRARTGSGKTAAFGLPIVHQIATQDRGGVQALILAPTRELALQVTDALRTYANGTPVRVCTIYGGAPYPPQLKALSSGVQIVVGTPGRVIDHIERGSLDLSKVGRIVLDEADEMLRMGFIEDVQTILDALPAERQIALFSATMPDPIRAVAEKHLRNPVEVAVESQTLTVHHIQQRWIRVPDRRKLDALVQVLRARPRSGGTLVFVRTRKDCAEAADRLAARGVAVDALHGDLNQSARERVLQRFRAEGLDVVIATDVAARGLDVEHIALVVNLDLPTDVETYVHRIGRTGRAGRSGLAISFVTPSERFRLRRMEHTLGAKMQEIDVPSDRDVALAHRTALQESVVASLEGSEHAAAWLAEVAASTGEDPLRLAAAAIHLLAKRDEVDLTPLPEAPPRRTERLPDAIVQPHPGPERARVATVRPSDGGDRSPARPDRAERPADDDRSDRFERDERFNRNDRNDRNDRARYHDEPPPDAPDLELFFPVGERHGVRPGDLVGAIANEAGVPGPWIGRVTILPRKSFVSLPAPVAEQLLAEFPTLTVRGKACTIALARQRSASEAHRPRKRQFHRGR